MTSIPFELGTKLSLLLSQISGVPKKPLGRAFYELCRGFAKSRMVNLLKHNTDNLRGGLGNAAHNGAGTRKEGFKNVHDGTSLFTEDYR